MFTRRCTAQISARTVRRVAPHRVPVYRAAVPTIARGFASAPFRSAASAALQSTASPARVPSAGRPGVSPINGESYTVGPTSEPLENRTLGDFFEATVRLYPESPALISRHEAPNTHSLAYAGGDLVNEECLRWNYVEFQENVDALARGLLKMGLKKGDRVGAFLGNGSPYAMLQWATAKVGVILTCINPAARGPELLSALNLSGCSALFISPTLKKSSHLPLLRELLPSLTSSAPRSLSDPACPTLRSIVICDNTKLGAKEFEKYLASEGFAGRDFRGILEWDGVGVNGGEKLDSQDVCNLQFTSGTTGNPKAVSLTHHNLLNNGIIVGDCMNLQRPSAEFAGEKLANIPPMFHCFGIVLGNLAVWTHGGCIVFPAETFDATATLRAVMQEKCTALHGVPTMFLAELALLDELDKGNHVKGLSDLKSTALHLRTGIAAGSPVPDELMRRLVKRMGLRDLTITYGMTETSPATVMSTTTDPISLRCETVGRVLPHTAIRIVDPNHDLYPSPDTPSVPIGTAGELWSAGYALQKSYWENVAETDKVHFTDVEGMRWIMTGDQAVMDEAGYISIVGRIKDIIIRGGENLYPVVIENRLLLLDGVFDCAVIAIPSEKFLEVPGVFVLRSPTPAGQALTKASIAQHVNTLLSHQSAPEWVFFMGEDTKETEWPKTASGKIRKVELRTWGKDLVSRGVGRVKSA